MTDVLGGGVHLGAGLGAAAACWQALRTRTAPARAAHLWRRLIGLGLLGWSLGQAVAIVHGLVDPVGDHVASVADAGRLLLPICGLLALLAIAGEAHRLRDASPRRERVVLVLDASLVTGSLFALTWSALLEPHLVVTGRATVVSAYPVVDAFLVVSVVLLLLTRPTPVPLRRPLALLGAGFLALTGADLLRLERFAAGEPGPDPAAAGLAVAAVALLACAVRARGGDGPPARTQFAALLLPYVPVVATGAIIAARAFTGRPLTAFEAYLGWLGLGLVVARQMLTIVDHSALLARLAEGRLRFMHQANHDALTGLANQTLFRERLTQAVERHRRHGQPVAVLFVDLDDFKLVNDNLGHAAGDRLLREVGERLFACVRRDDLVARLGGDEFAILIEGQVANVEPVGQRILAALREPFTVEARAVTVGASVGLVIPDGDDGDLSADALLRRADTAMYAGKRRGKGALVRYAGGGRADVDLPRLLARALADTPASSGFEVHYQPVVRLSDGATVAVEALARWRDPVAGVIDPDVFVIVAERTGMVSAIDDFVLDRACADAGVLAERYGAPVDLHVNVSAGRLGSPQLEGAVEDALRRHALDPDRLVLEITETRRIPDLPAAAAAARRLRALGVRLALDDFGSGFNALAQLHALPVDIVKLDASLTAVEVEPERSGALCRSVVAICAELRVAVVAEGVEREAQAGALAKLGLGFGQGYLFGAPRPVDRLPSSVNPA